MTDKTKCQDPYIRIAVLENAIEAQLMASILTDQEIPHHIRSHHDTAYDGLFQTQKGWGEIQAPEQYQTVIEKTLEHVRNDNIIE